MGVVTAELVSNVH